MGDSIYEMLNQRVSVSRETFEKMTAYCDLLLKWQAKINLVGGETQKEVWGRHFLDSAQLSLYIKDKNAIIADLGSGAGFPALVLAVMGYGNIHLIESDKRKGAFLREAARVTGANVAIHNCRIEDVVLPEVGVVTSRACASLNKLLHLVENKVSRETIYLFHKGKNYSMELEDAKKHWDFDFVVIPSVSDMHGVVVQVSNLQKRCSNE